METRKPLHTCCVVGCKELTRATRCEKHEAEHQERAAQRTAKRNYDYDKYQRDAEATAFYRTAAWIRARGARLMQDNFLCQECLRKKRFSRATTVHHLVPVRTMMNRALDLNNLESLCASCHSKGHFNEMERKGR